MNEKGVTTIELKKINKKAVYHYIYNEKQTSKLQIVQDLHMGLSTVSQNLNVLEEEGLIERKGYFESTGGRKAQVIQIVSQLKVAIGIGLLKDMIQIVSIDLYGETIAVKTVLLPYSNTAQYYDAVAEAIGTFIDEYHYTTGQILGVSIATQGVISPDGTYVTYGDIMNNTGMQLSDFSSRLPYPCHLEHDSKAAACLELWNHADIESAVVFLLNRNLGGAIITNHSIHQGSTMHSGCIEHMCVNSDGPVCYCGNRGCLESYCSANALENSCGMTVKDFFSTLRTHPSAKLLRIWHDYLDHLAFAIRNINLIIDSPVIISGYLAPYFTDEDLTYLHKQSNLFTPFSISRKHFLVGTHGQYTPAIGAALFYIEDFLQTISV